MIIFSVVRVFADAVLGSVVFKSVDETMKPWGFYLKGKAQSESKLNEASEVGVSARFNEGLGLL